jgi:hypothetical protein
MTKRALRAHQIAELVPYMTPDQYDALVYESADTHRDVRRCGARRTPSGASVV